MYLETKDVYFRTFNSSEPILIRLRNIVHQLQHEYNISFIYFTAWRILTLTYMEQNREIYQAGSIDVKINTYVEKNSKINLVNSVNQLKH